MFFFDTSVYDVTPSEIRMKEDGEVVPAPIVGSKIVDFYRNKSVLVTGATGYLGKLTVEKLLRTCDDIETIYILVRPKKGEDEETRVEKLYSDLVFEPLRKYRPKFQHKIVILKGDAARPNLGLSDQDQEIIRNNVHVIFHLAATVRFDEKITIATAINVRGTRDVLNIAKSCRKLESVVYVSTAFTNIVKKDIGEVIYTPKMSGDDLIALVETETEDDLVARTDSLISPWPNTYAFTKSVAEEVVERHGKGLPVCVFRPSIVAATYREPLRGWIDNLYGVTGVLMGAGTGLMRVLHCDAKCAAEVVPGDYVINGMIASSYSTARDAKKTKEGDMKVYNYVSSTENRIDWQTLMDYSQLYGIPNPSVRSVWYYCFSLIANKTLYKMLFFLLHYVPGFLVDLALRAAGKEPMLVKVYKKVAKFSNVIAYFSTNEWNFENDNVRALWTDLGEADRAAFPFSMALLDWDDYHKTAILGLRTFLLKEDPASLPEARTKWRRLYYAHQILKGFFFLLVGWLLYSLAKIIFSFLL